MTTPGPVDVTRRPTASGRLLVALVAMVIALLSACAAPSSTTLPAPTSADSFPIAQEIIYFSAPGGVLSSRTERIPYTRGSTPDAEVRAHVGWDASPPPGSLVHSTSWRFDKASGELILTWAVTPDPRPQAAVTPVEQKPVAQGADAAHPVPTGLGDQAVITHAARHLAFLMTTDREVDAALGRQPEVHAALKAFAPALAGNPGAAP